MLRFLLLPALWLAVACPPLLAASNPDGPNAVEAEMAVLAKEWAAALKQQKVKAVSVAPFRSPQGMPGVPGLELQQELTRALKKQKVTIDPESPFQIHGTLASYSDPESPYLGVKINSWLEHNGKKQGQPLFRELYGQESVARLLGITYHIMPTADYQFRSEAMRRNLPPVAVNGLMKTRPDSPFGVSLLVDGRPARWEGGKYPALQVPPDARWVLRIENNAPHAVGVRISLDGLNVLTPLGENAGEYLKIDSASHLDLAGWVTSPKQPMPFSRTSFPIAHPHRNRELELLCVSFSAVWSPEARPEDEDYHRGEEGFITLLSDLQKTQAVNLGQVREVLCLPISYSGSGDESPPDVPPGKPPLQAPRPTDNPLTPATPPAPQPPGSRERSGSRDSAGKPEPDTQEQPKNQPPAEPAPEQKPPDRQPSPGNPPEKRLDNPPKPPATKSPKPGTSKPGGSGADAGSRREE